MGQKTHPIGLRIGIYRKWNTTWFAEKNDYKTSFFAQLQVEQFFKFFFYFYSYTKISKTKRVWLVDLKWYRLGVLQVYIFIFFYKFRTVRGHFVRKLKKKFKRKFLAGNFKSKIKKKPYKKFKALKNFLALDFKSKKKKKLLRILQINKVNVII